MKEDGINFWYRYCRWSESCQCSRCTPTGTNEGAFSALPAGIYTPVHSFYGINELTSYWSKSDTGNLFQGKTLKYGSNMVSTIQYESLSKLSVRCISDSNSYNPVIPLSRIDTVKDILCRSAVIEYAVLKDGRSKLVSHGICWDTKSNPDTTKCISNKNGIIGSYVINLKDLNPGTTYYVRTFAVNGVGLGYGKELVFESMPKPGDDFDSISDIDGNIYKTVKIGKQIWLAENLRTTKLNDGVSIPNINTCDQWSDLLTAAYCYDNTNHIPKPPSNPLYNWFTINTAKLCPTNWHVPSNIEWQELFNTVGGRYEAGRMLRDTCSIWGYEYPKVTTNETGFSALPGSYCTENQFFVYCPAIYWSSSEYDSEFAGTFSIDLYDVSINSYGYDKRYGLPVRCIKDTNYATIQIPSVVTKDISGITQTIACSGGNILLTDSSTVLFKGICWSTYHNPDTGNCKIISGNGFGSYSCFMENLIPNTLYYVRAFAVNKIGIGYGNERIFKTKDSLNYGGLNDIDGNKYRTTRIGNQNWMADNLKTTRFNTKVPIPNIADSIIWRTSESPAYCWAYNNIEFKDLNGALYNWYCAGNDDICPVGWHVPTKSEFEKLINYLGGDSVAGGKMKEIGNKHWGRPNIGATNETGYSAIPGPLREYFLNSAFINRKEFVNYWSSSSVDSETTKAIIANIQQLAKSLNLDNQEKYNGYYIRCVEDEN